MTETTIYNEGTLVSSHGFSINLHAVLENAGLPFAAITKALDNKTVMYLLTNGFSQSIVDAGAMPSTEVTKAVIAAGRNPEDTEVFEEVKTQLQYSRREKRLADILAGNVGTTLRGRRRKGFESYLFLAAVEALKTAMVKNGNAWPKGKGSAEKIRGIVEEYWSKPRKSHEAVRAKASALYEAAQMDSATETDNMDDILLDV